MKMKSILAIQRIYRRIVHKLCIKTYEYTNCFREIITYEQFVHKTLFFNVVQIKNQRFVQRLWIKSLKMRVHSDLYILEKDLKMVYHSK